MRCDLAAGKRRRRAGQREIFEPHVEQKAQPAANLLQDFGRDHGPRVVQLQVAEKIDRLGNAQAQTSVSERAGRSAKHG